MLFRSGGELDSLGVSGEGDESREGADHVSASLVDLGSVDVLVDGGVLESPLSGTDSGEGNGNEDDDDEEHHTSDDQPRFQFHYK